MVTPFITQRQQVGIKLEAVEGTGETIAAADLVHPAFDIEWTPNGEMNERNNLQPSLSRVTQVAGEFSATVTFSTEVKGSGVAGDVPGNLSAALQACAFGETIVGGVSVTYAPASQSTKSATIEVREGSGDGTFKIKKIVGARGTVSFVAEKGIIVLAVFEFTGRYVEPTEGAALVVPAPTPLPEPFLGASFSFHGTTLKVAAVTLDMQNTISLRNDANQTFGNFSAAFVDRAPVGSIDPEQEEIADINFFNKWTTNSEGILTYILGSTAGNITTFTAPKAQITGISEGDRDGIRIETIDLQLSQDEAAGDDELTIAFT